MTIQPQKWRQPARPTKTPKPVQLTARDRSRFWANVRKTESGCWLWTGRVDARGRPRLALECGRDEYGYRVAMMVLLDRPLRSDECVRHVCGDFKAAHDKTRLLCCRAGDGHLVVGTTQQNREDRSRREIRMNGRRPRHSGEMSWAKVRRDEECRKRDRTW